MLLDFHLFDFVYSGFGVCWGWAWGISALSALS